MGIGIVIASLIMAIFWGYIIIHSVMNVMKDISDDPNFTFIDSIAIILLFVIMLVSLVCLIYLIV